MLMEPEKVNASLCPLCKDLGRSGELFLRQLNTKEALYVCNNSRCPYPVGISTETISRPVRELLEQPPESVESVPQVVSHEEATNDSVYVVSKPLVFDSEMNELLLDFLDQQT